MKTCSILEEVAEKLKDKSVCSTSELVNLGIFGCHNSVLVALKRGDLPFVRISPRRLIVAKKDLLKFIESNFQDKKKNQGRET
jgi:hypothetical protein